MQPPPQQQQRPFLLCQELFAHAGDVRALCVLADGVTLVSGSRDRTTRLYMWNPATLEYDTNVSIPNNHWICSLLALPVPLGGFVAGDYLGVLRSFDASARLRCETQAHTSQISSLALFGEGKFVSGSWDGTAKTWQADTLQCLHTFGGHENAVCVLGLPDGRLVTGSSGVKTASGASGFRLRVWGANATEPERVLETHTGPIRSLALVSGEFLVSTSNDATTQVLSISRGFALEAVLSNPPSPVDSPAWNYCVCALANQAEVVVCGEDRSMRVWDLASRRATQAVLHPCTVWTLCELGSGDVVTAGSDGALRVFSRTRDPLGPEARAAFDAQSRQSLEALQAKVGGQVDPSTLCPIEQAPPGTSDQVRAEVLRELTARAQMVKMFNKQGRAWVYQWEGQGRHWVEVGEVAGPTGDGPQGKTRLEDKWFDVVLPVEVESAGRVVKLQLGFNNEDNPHSVASAFCRRYELPDDYVQQIVDFIAQQRGRGGVPTIGEASSSSPPRAPSSRAFPLPSAAGLVFDKGNVDGALKRLLKTSGELPPDQRLSPLEQVHLTALGQALQGASPLPGAVTLPMVELLAQRPLTSWPLPERFPAQDVLRAVLLHPDGPRRLAGQLGSAVFAACLANACRAEAPPPVQLTGLRACANFFAHAESAQAALACLRGEAGGALEGLASRVAAAELNLRLALATLLLNVANAVVHGRKNDRDSALMGQCARAASRLVGGADEAQRRALMALGCVALFLPVLVRLDEVLAGMGAGDKNGDVLEEVVNVVGA